MAFTIRTIKYCRGCNREFEVDHRFGSMLAENTPRGMHYHPIVDCDDREQFSGDKVS